MATKTNDVVNKSVVDTLEQLLQRSVIDLEFRRELLTNPEEFGISADSEELVLPIPVEQQDMSFVELVTDANEIANCVTTCVSGFTLICDGSSYKQTCVTGLTWKCDG